jgi:hypothetical protein
LDKPKASQELLDLLYIWSSADYITLKESTFQGHFADWKNELTAMCKGDYVCNIDADEIPNEILIANLPEIIENNDFDSCMIPRVNTVEGIGLHSLNKWGWSVSKLESQIREKELDLDDPKDRDEYELLKKYDLIIEESKD